MSARHPRIVVITPCRDEAPYLLGTIETMAVQSVRPTKWIIVDDGSTDGTDAILEEARRQHEFIEVVRRDDRGHRAVGPGVVDAFYAGLERVDLDAFDVDDSEGSGLSYQATGGADQARFSVNGNTGGLTFVDRPDYEVPVDTDPNNVEAQRGLQSVQKTMVDRALEFARDLDFESARRILEDAALVRQDQALIEQDLRGSLAEFGLDRQADELRQFAETVIRNYDPCISCATHFLRLQVIRE